MMAFEEDLFVVLLARVEWGGKAFLVDNSQTGKRSEDLFLLEFLLTLIRPTDGSLTSSRSRFPDGQGGSSSTFRLLRYVHMSSFSATRHLLGNRPSDVTYKPILTLNQQLTTLTFGCNRGSDPHEIKHSAADVWGRVHFFVFQAGSLPLL